ncbi:MAG: hypothetical protein L6Q55_14770, partial [Azonexus sp.]
TRNGEARGVQEGLPVYYLNHSNRPVRTRMPGGVGGAQLIMAAPYPDHKYFANWRHAPQSNRQTRSDRLSRSTAKKVKNLFPIQPFGSCGR